MPSRHSKRLGEAELEIMQILWSAQAPLTARQILQQLGDRRTWALSTLMTALARLGEKGFVRCDRSTRTISTPQPSLPRPTRPRRANPFWHGCTAIPCPAWWPASTTVVPSAKRSCRN